MANTIVKWIVIFPLIAWFMMAATSPMMLGGPGASDNRGTLLTVVGLLSYPLIIFGIFWLLDWKFFFFHVKYWFGIYLLLYLIVTSYVYKDLANNLKGIKNEGFSIVDEQVYFNGKPHLTADAETLTFPKEKIMHSYPWWAWDQNHLYYNGDIVDGVTPDLNNPPRSFHPEDSDMFISPIVINDKLIYDNKVLEGVSATNTRPLKGRRSILLVDTPTNVRVFISDKEKPHLDGDSLELLGGTYLRDKNNLYTTSGDPISGIQDKATFEITFGDIDFAKDKHASYILINGTAHPLENVDINSFEILSFRYMKDKNNVYYVDDEGKYRTIANADPNTFNAKGGLFEDDYAYHAFDKQHYYVNDEVMEGRGSPP